MTAGEASLRSLRALARLCGVQTAYLDDRGRRRDVSPESLLAVLQALRPGIDGLSSLPAALREEQERLGNWRVEPVLVAWDGRAPTLQIQLPRSASGRVELRLELEGSDAYEWRQQLDEAASSSPDGTVRANLPFPVGDLPPGYHLLTLRAPGGIERSCTVISAPSHAYEKADGRQRWGVFLPLYALHTASSWGAGDYSDLAAFGEWVATAGGSLVATLPLLPIYLDEPYDPSPYSPVSRLFWNEFYVDPRRAPGIQACSEAAALLASPAFEAEVAALRSSPRVDYRRQMALKRAVLTRLASCAFDSSERSEIEAFVAANPDVRDYARFRTWQERLTKPWRQWPSELPAAAEDNAYRFYLYSQYLASRQLADVAASARARDGEVYLDVPLGSHPDGYDSWRHPGSFVHGMACGAPPDSTFPGGQNWGFPPLHPLATRADGHSLFRRVIAHHLQLANVLRIDHVMGLHRLFWVPAGASAREGTYVRYPAEELYAILCLESQRHHATVLGENLGTVPSYVDRALARRRIYGSYVLQYALAVGPTPRLRPPARRSFASLNTHDMPPFAGWLRGRDIDERAARGLLTPGEVRSAHKERRQQRSALVAALVAEGLLRRGERDESVLFRAAMTYLRSSRARYVLISAEDTWQETESQNVPGTTGENWTRRARLPLEQFPGL